jgi:hypothetical protein
MGFDAEAAKAPWVANSPLHALRLLRGLEYDAALASHSIHLISQGGIPDYQAYNEVKRDRIFLSRSLEFLRSEPILTLNMLLWKTVAFLTFWELGLSLVSLTAFIGGSLFIKDVRIFGILVLVVGYMAPYVVSLPLYYRYRSPIEPMLLVLSGLLLDVVLQKTKPVWLILQKRFQH